MAPLGHWLYFLPEARESDLGPDGHPARGGFLPPVALPRRMWAGGRVDFLSPIPLGAEMTRRSTIIDIVDKSGSSGPMTFVVVRHEISLQGRLAVREEQDIVYRGASGQDAPAAADGASASAERYDFRRCVAPGPVELFRYSALTFNGHRIHYDRDYATGAEGYPGLVVHGPLIATMLVDTLLAMEARNKAHAFHLSRSLTSFRRHSVRPLRQGLARRRKALGAGARRARRDGRAGVFLGKRRRIEACCWTRGQPPHVPISCLLSTS